MGNIYKSLQHSEDIADILQIQQKAPRGPEPLCL